MNQKTLAAAADKARDLNNTAEEPSDVFLATRNEIVAWQTLCYVAEPHYPKRRNELGRERVPAMRSPRA